MAQNITLLGANYSSVPAVTLPKTGGGTASFTDVTDTTATAADVASGKYFYTSSGVRTAGTNSGGGGGQDVFVVTIIGGGDEWEPTCTFEEYAEAYIYERPIVVTMLENSQAGCELNEATDISLTYTVYYESVTSSGDTIRDHATFYWDENGITPVVEPSAYVTTNATASASDIATGKIAFNASGRVVGTNSGGGGGGGSSFASTGTFTTGSTRATKETFTTDYSGSGYPIALTIFVDGGAYNNTSAGNTEWYNSTNRYDVGVYNMTKSVATQAPTYATSGTANQGVVSIIYKNSTSTATTYTRTSTMTANSFSSNDAGNSSACARFKGNKNTVSYYIGNMTSSTLGLAPDTTYRYVVLYSE